MRMEWGSEVVAIFRRWNTKLLRQPIVIFFSLINPLVWFLLFTQAFSAIGGLPNFQGLTGTKDYTTFFTAAVIIQTVTSSALQAGIGLVNDLDSGFMDKMRVAPINKSSILFGKLFSDAITTVVQVIIILALAAAFGIAWSGLSLFVALTTKSAQTTLSVGLLTTFPLLFLSAAVLPVKLLPNWVQSVAVVNPFTYIAEVFQSLIIRGFEWGVIGNALATILIIGAITLTASISVFRRKVS
jgi:ABC-2 type transport system permease protein